MTKRKKIKRTWWAFMDDKQSYPPRLYRRQRQAYAFGDWMCGDRTGWRVVKVTVEEA